MLHSYSKDQLNAKDDRSFDKNDKCDLLKQSKMTMGKWGSYQSGAKTETEKKNWQQNSIFVNL